MKTVEDTPEQIIASSWFRPIIKALVLLGVMLAVLWLIYGSPLRQSLGHLREMNTHLSRMGFWAPLIFTVAVALLVAAGCPRLLLCPIGGMAFGFWEGLLWSQLGTLIGSYLLFLFVRWSGQELVLRRWPKLGQLRIVLERHGVFFVMLIRQVPVWGVFLNLILGLSPVHHFDFLIGTLIGNLPEAIPCTLIGSSALQPHPSQSAWQIGLAVSLLLLVWLGIGLYLRFSKTASMVKDKVEQAMEQKESHVR